MRSESEIIQKLVTWVEQSDNIRVLRLIGSRMDPTGHVDDLSDYDVELFVRDRKPFIRHEAWITQFGSVMVRWPLQPSPTNSDEWITQLVQYRDGVRIDFQITDQLASLFENARGAYRVLVDKDHNFTETAGQTYDTFKITPPDEESYASRVNAFWWDIVYVPKALCRDELNYAKFMLDGTIRFDKLQPLIEWYIGITTGWNVNTGKFGRWFRHYLPSDLWFRYEETFAGPDLDDNWRALFATIDFTRTVATTIAQDLSFTYPFDIDASVTAYIKKLYDRYKTIPRDQFTQ